MAGTNEFVPHGAGAGANVLSPSAWAALPARQSGFQAGILPSVYLNTPLRQATAFAAALGQFIVEKAGLSALDNGDIETLMNSFVAGLQAVGAASAPPSQSLWHIGDDTSATPGRILATVAPAISAYGRFQYRIRAAQNCPGNTVANFNGVGDRQIVRSDRTPLQAGDFRAGQEIDLSDDGTYLQFVGPAPSEAYQTFITNFYGNPTTYWELYSPSVSVPADALTVLSNYGGRLATVGSGTDVSAQSGVVTIGPNDAGVYVLTATNAMDQPTTEEAIFIFLQRPSESTASAIATSRGPYPSPGTNANDQGTARIIRLGVGDKVYAVYRQSNDQNASRNSLNQSLGHFAGGRVGG